MSDAEDQHHQIRHYSITFWDISEEYITVAEMERTASEAKEQLTELSDQKNSQVYGTCIVQHLEPFEAEANLNDN